MFLHIVGARPNFPKVKPLMEEMRRRGISQKLLHTGQHYDYLMSKVFFSQLDIPVPDFHLDGYLGKTHAEQTGNMMIELEKVFEKLKPEGIIVYGDINSTLFEASSDEAAVEVTDYEFCVEEHATGFKIVGCEITSEGACANDAFTLNAKGAKNF